MKNIMQITSPDFKLVEQLCFRLLPVQILLALVSVANGIFSSLFASNYIGTQALSAVGLYSPVHLFVGAISMMLLGGSQILVGQCIGKNQQEKASNIFSLNIVISVIIGLFTTFLLAIVSIFDFTELFIKDVQIRQPLNQYLLGSAIGILPQLVGQQLSGFLSIENRNNRTTVASVACILSTVALNYLFIVVLDLEAFGLALASSLGLWVFFAVEAQFYFIGKSELLFSSKKLEWINLRQIVSTGISSALGNGYLTIRSIIVNALLLHYVGSIGLSAFVACNSFLEFFWAIPSGMCAVSRILISVSIGEEDRTTLKEIMGVAFFRYVPIMIILAVIICFSAEPLTYLYCKDANSALFDMTAWGFRILPFCMPLAIICMHFVCYGQASSKHFLVHLLSVFDGLISVAVFSALLIPFVGIKGVYYANVINGVMSLIIILVYSCIKVGHLPHSMDNLMVIPKNFGVSRKARIDITLHCMEDAVGVSRQIHSFCLNKGVDNRRAFFSALALEEMTTIIIEHGFKKPKHAIVLRVTCKDDSVILRLKDNCKPFDASIVRELINPLDPVAHIGIRMIRSIVQEMKYQKILGMNTLTLKI